MSDAGESQTFGAGSLLFARKNFLAKFTKQSAENGPFRAITAVFDHVMLLKFSQQHGGGCERPDGASPAVMAPAPSPLLSRPAKALHHSLDG